MTEIVGYKPLEQAIINGEKKVKIVSPRLLMACAVAEKCQSDYTSFDNLVGLVMAAKSDKRQYNKNTTYYLLNNKGKPFTQHVTLTTIADALHIIKILDALYITISPQKNDDGHLTGIVNII